MKKYINDHIQERHEEILYKKISIENAKEFLCKHERENFNKFEMKQIHHLIPRKMKLRNKNILTFWRRKKSTLHIRKFDENWYLVHIVKMPTIDLCYLCDELKGLLEFLKNEFSK